MSLTWIPFKVILSSERVLCVYVLSGNSTRKQLVRGRFFEGLQNYMKNKYDGDLKLGDLNFSIDKMDRDGGNRKQRLYRCCSNYAL